MAAIPNNVMSALIPRGSVEAIRARTLRYFEAGLDTAFLALMTTEPDPARTRAILVSAVRALGPRAR